jgi:hypothetical protein
MAQGVLAPAGRTWPADADTPPPMPARSAAVAATVAQIRALIARILAYREGV